MKTMSPASWRLRWSRCGYTLSLLSFLLLSHASLLAANKPAKSSIIVYEEALPSGRALPPTRTTWDEPDLHTLLRTELLALQLSHQADCVAPGALDSLLAQVSKELDFLSLSKAEVLLKQADLAIQCSPEPITRAQLTHYTGLQALLALHAKKPATFWLSLYTALAPTSQQPGDQPPFIEWAFRQSWAENAKRVWIRFIPQTLPATVKLYINGEAWSPAESHFTPAGPVLLQLFRQTGVRLASGWVAVPGASPSFEWPADANTLPSAEALMALLQGGFEAPLTPTFETVLRRVALNSPGKRLAIQVNASTDPLERWLVVEGAQEVVRLRRVHVPEPTAPAQEALPQARLLETLKAPSMSRLVIVASGALAVVGGSFYLQQYLRFDEATVASEAERDAILQRIQAGRVLGLVGLAGVGIGVGLELTGFPSGHAAEAPSLRARLIPHLYSIGAY